MGLPPGWVTDVAGLSWTAHIHVLGNGVVPLQAQTALRLLLRDAGLCPRTATTAGSTAGGRAVGGCGGGAVGGMSANPTTPTDTTPTDTTPTEASPESGRPRAGRIGRQGSGRASAADVAAAGHATARPPVWWLARRVHRERVDAIDAYRAEIALARPALPDRGDPLRPTPRPGPLRLHPRRWAAGGRPGGGRGGRGHLPVARRVGGVGEGVAEIVRRLAADPPARHPIPAGHGGRRRHRHPTAAR